jgi:hypothetical protein
MIFLMKHQQNRLPLLLNQNQLRILMIHLIFYRNGKQNKNLKKKPNSSFRFFFILHIFVQYINK